MRSPALARSPGPLAKVASRYDTHLQILDVSATACQTLNGEPFIRFGRDVTANKALCAAGYSLEADANAHRVSLKAMMDIFMDTRISLALHTGWQEPLKDGTCRVSWPDLRAIVNEFRGQYGGRLIVQDNGLAPGDQNDVKPGETAATASNLWSWFTHAGQPYGFQCKGDLTLQAMGKTVADAAQAAIALKGAFLEHQQFGTDAALAKQWDAALRAHAAP